MDREIERDEQPDRESQRTGRWPSRGSRNGHEPRSSEPSPATVHSQIERASERPIHHRPQSDTANRDVPKNPERQREYHLNPVARESIKDIGRFRTVAVNDLAQQRYAGDVEQTRRQLRSLKGRGLVQLRTIWAGKKGGKIQFVALTPEGKRLLESEAGQTGQVFYDRFVKPAEILHDAAIYRMYQAERDRIERAGGRIRRVVLDYELKQRAYSPLAKAKALPALDYARRQEEIARENSLKVVQGHITLPDLRIEYETADGIGTHADLELATEHYRGGHLASKAEAGFTMYASAGDSGRLNAVLEEREITAEILSL